MRIDMAEVGGAPVLSGAINGKAAFASLMKLVDRQPKEPTPLFLDFRNVETATASYLRESVFALKTYMRTTNSKYYPVVANVNHEIWDEMAVIAALKNDAMVSCSLDGRDKPSAIELVGSLDPKQKMTFDVVSESGQVDANGLMERFGESEGTKGTTAWNNRLAALVARGIVREFVQGRAKTYKPVLEESP